MFNPVRLTGAYPELKASVGPGIGPTINGPTDGPAYRGGPVYGLADVSQPNTSPDTLTINGILQFEKEMTEASTTLPSGTPVLVVFDNNAGNRDKRHHEPVHRIYTDNFPFTPTVHQGEQGSVMLTVLVGTAQFKRGQASHCAIAIQNVTTVFLTPKLLSGFELLNASSPQDFHLGDSCYIVAGIDGNKGYLRVVKNLGTPPNRPNGGQPGRLQVLMLAVRCMKVCVTPLQNEMKCDMGRLIRNEF